MGRMMGPESGIALMLFGGMLAVAIVAIVAIVGLLIMLDDKDSL